ncbi:hypothetical protein NM688_g2927 [Phlebia brevispora]|uniref:Uncharacterized protein n=1 Tax=Phlebia brevispora TaxID=194682 RepID=A0ACC1T7F0_9APHY|nr:hypothetical protein NM688_g2927 [Phlebia brevispora]
MLCSLPPSIDGSSTIAGCDLLGAGRPGTSPHLNSQAHVQKIRAATISIIHAHGDVGASQLTDQGISRPDPERPEHHMPTAYKDNTEVACAGRSMSRRVRALTKRAPALRSEPRSHTARDVVDYCVR